MEASIGAVPPPGSGRASCGAVRRGGCLARAGTGKAGGTDSGSARFRRVKLHAPRRENRRMPLRTWFRAPFPAAPKGRGNGLAFAMVPHSLLWFCILNGPVFVCLSQEAGGLYMCRQHDRKALSWCRRWDRSTISRMPLRPCCFYAEA